MEHPEDPFQAGSWRHAGAATGAGGEIRGRVEHLGVEALLRDAAGGVEISFFGPDGPRTAPAPEDTEQIVPAENAPIRVWLLLPDGLATLATLAY